LFICKRGKKANIIERSVFISCCGDCEPEAQKIIKICETLSKTYRTTKNLTVYPIYYSKDIVGTITGDGAQEIIDQQLGDYDIYLGLMWKRYGNPQINNFSPTQVEFENAYARYQKIGKPVIQFYFKNEGIDPNCNDNQINFVLKFKGRIQNLGFYHSLPATEDFYHMIFHNLMYIVEKFDELTHKKITITKICYLQQEGYITRQVCSAKNFDSTSII